MKAGNRERGGKGKTKLVQIHTEAKSYVRAYARNRENGQKKAAKLCIAGQYGAIASCVVRNLYLSPSATLDFPPKISKLQE